MGEIRTIGPKKIAVGDLGEFWYGNYKEPFVQLEGAVSGYPQGVVLKDDDGRLLCAYCGKTFEYLPRHISRAHAMTTREYKQEVGLMQKSALVSERIRTARVRTALRNMSIPSVNTILAARGPGRKRGSKHEYTAEQQNKSGRCFAQILTVARQIVNARGQVTIKDMHARGIWQYNIEMMFGSMQNLARLAGDDRHMGQWTQEELLTALRSLGDKLGRTPASSDLRRYGLPGLMSYFRAFGSYRTACERAGLQAYKWVPRDTKSEAAYLLAWATTGDVHKASKAIGVSGLVIRQTLTKYGVPKMPPGGGFHTERIAVRNQAAEIAAHLEGVPAITILPAPDQTEADDLAILEAFVEEGTIRSTQMRTGRGQRSVEAALMRHGVPRVPRGPGQRERMVAREAAAAAVAKIRANLVA